MRNTTEEAEMALQIGDPAPAFTLPGADTFDHSFRGGDGVTVVIFTCNHCPYALAWEDRLLDAGRDYFDRGVRFYAINPNDAEQKPKDSFEEMQRRIAEKPWPFPYLRDESQEVAAAYGALTTPDVFVFDADDKLAYRGAPDADYDDPAQNAQWLRDALDAVLAGDAPATAETKPVGCSVKWLPQ
jgi:peroxiredoxin